MIPETSKYTPLDRLFSLFTKLRPGEGRSLFLLFWLGFAFMYCQWVLKPVRDALILSEADAEMAAYGNAVQALILMFMIPLYGILYRRLSKIHLVQAVTVFFIGTILLFYVLYEAGIQVYFPFWVWAGIYGTMMIAQFWALAADHYNVKSGQRLFAVLAAGVSLGALVGPGTVSQFVSQLGMGGMMLVVAGILTVTLFLPQRAVDAIPEGSRSVDTTEDDGEKQSVLGGFAVVLKDRYLILIAAWVVIQNIVDSTGDWVFREAVQKHAQEVVANGDGSMTLANQIGINMGNYYFVMNLVVFLLALLVVSRLIRWLGINRAILILPSIMVVGYALIAVAPGLQFIPIFSLIWIYKITEKGFNYSLNNTIRGALFLPTSQCAKYEGKTTIDTFFWRFGDLLQAGIIFVALNWLDFGLTEVALLTMWLAVLMLWLAWKLGRHYKAMATSGSLNEPPKLGRSISDAEVVAGGAFQHVLHPETFLDPDPGEVLVLTAAQMDGSPLPPWVRFDPGRLIFEGTAPAELTEELVIQVTATDVDGASITETFRIRRTVRVDR